MITDILTACYKLIDNFKAHPLITTLLAVLIAIALFATFSGSEKLDSLIKSPSEEKVVFHRTLVANREISKIITKTRIKVGADRITVRQFHNGSSDLGGNPFTSITTKDFDMADGVSTAAMAFETKPLQSMNQMLFDMFPANREPRCVSLKVADIKDIEYRAYLTELGAVKTASCPMVSEEGDRIGIITISYFEDNNLLDRDVLSVLDEASQKVSYYIRSVTVEKNSHGGSYGNLEPHQTLS